MDTAPFPLIIRGMEQCIKKKVKEIENSISEAKKQKLDTPSVIKQNLGIIKS